MPPPPFREDYVIREEQNNLVQDKGKLKWTIPKLSVPLFLFPLL